MIATAYLARIYLEQTIDMAGWVGIGLITLGLMMISKYSNIDV